MAVCLYRHERLSTSADLSIGGKTEEERCLQLSKQLEIEVSPGQFICGHTPMREMAKNYRTVLVVGGEGEKCRQVAEGYGFKDVVTPGDIIKDNADTTPFRKLTSEEHTNSRARNFNQLEIDAIFVFADSRDWAGDQQIILGMVSSPTMRIYRPLNVLRSLNEPKRATRNTVQNL